MDGVVEFYENYQANGFMEVGTSVRVLNFTNKELDRDLELNYFGARYYQPEFPRFLSPDPVGGSPEVPISWNRYLYCRNDPINRLDPDGREDIIIFTTERNPTRDPVNPWGLAAAYLADQYEEQYSADYATLNVKILDVNSVSQVDAALSAGEDIVQFAFVGHSGTSSINVGNASAPDTNISSNGGVNDVDPTCLNWENLVPEAEIAIHGCNAGNGSNCVAQDVADAAGAPVTAPSTYLNFSEETGEPFFRWWRGGTYNTFTPANTPNEGQ